VIVLLAAIDVLATGIDHFAAQTTYTREVRRELTELSRRPAPLRVDFGHSRSNRIRYAEHGLRYVEADSRSGDFDQLFFSDAKVGRD
jgi:hypothetical protein